MKLSTKTKKSSKEESNRRVHPRIKPNNLWIRERTGDYEFVCKTSNISLGGILLEKRLLTKTSMATELLISNGSAQISLQAVPLEERKTDLAIGTAYSFINMNAQKESQLKLILKDL